MLVDPVRHSNRRPPPPGGPFSRATMCAGDMLSLRVQCDSTRSSVRKAVDATRAAVADTRLATSAAEAQLEELRCAEEMRETAGSRREKLRLRLTSLQLRNEELLKRKAEDLKKIQTLERLAGPCVQHVVYEAGRRPEVIGWTGRRAASTMPVVMSKFRDRDVEAEVVRLGREIDVMKAKLTAQRRDLSNEISREQYKSTSTQDSAFDALKQLHKRRRETQVLAMALSQRLVAHRVDTLTKEEALQESIDTMRTQLDATNADLEQQRARRTSDMAAALNRAKFESRTVAATIADETVKQTEMEAKVLKEAAEKRARDDEKINVLHAKVDRLVRQCRRLSSAKHYDMSGLASDVGIVRNDLKMLECFLTARRERNGSDAIAAASQTA